MIRRMTDWILKRRIAYRSTFMPNGQMTKATQDVLTDLRSFCRGSSAPVVISPITQTTDPIATGIAIGRQEVWHRIMSHLHVSDADIYRLLQQQEPDE